MYIILAWAVKDSIQIMIEPEGHTKLFSTFEEAGNFAEQNCPYSYKIVEV